MPLARSNTSKSRSPAPDFKRLTSPRPFLPPSHYAAAAGLSYSAKSTRSDSGNSSDLDASFMSKDSQEDSPYHISSFVPVSYPTELGSASDSSFEFNVSSSRHGDKSSSSRRSSVRSKRQSHITGLPLLEAQLLPSLRDTIDRMTRSPASAVSSPSLAGATRLDIPRHQNSMRTTRSPSLSSDPPASTTSHPDTPTTPSSWNSLARTPTTPEPTSVNLHSSSTAPVGYSTPRSKMPTKSALKSTLRPPTPKLASGPSPVTETPVNTHSTGVSLKSVRNLCRKLSAGSLSASSMSSRKLNPKSSKPDASSSSRHVRKRSCTDPGSLSSVEVLFLSDDSRIPATPQTPLRTPKLGAQSKSGFLASSIPRPRTRSNRPSPSVHTQDSDVEFRYEVEGRDRRKLVVANAEVFPSSSESDVDKSEAIKMIDDGIVETRPWGPAEIPQTNAGLGFDLRIALNNRGSRESGGRHQQDVKWSDKGDPAWNSRTPMLHARGMQLNSNRSDRENGNARGSIRNSNGDPDDEHQRRRAALLGIVSRLELGSSLPTPMSAEGEESEYFGEEGFAISGSGELADRIPQHMEPEETSEDGSVYGEGDEDGEGFHSMHIYQQQDEARPGSSNRMPTFLLSTEDPHGQTYDHEIRKSESSLTSSSTSGTGPRASSRSPIVRNEHTDIPIPAALRKHSVYHRSPSLASHLEARESTMEPTNSGQHTRPPSPRLTPAENRAGSACARPRGRTWRRDRDSEQSDAVLIAERSHAAAARERRAFGIPPSESVEVYQQRASQLLSHADSNLSSVGSAYWDDEEELSAGAETLFERLSEKEMGRKSQNRSENGLQKSVMLESFSASSAYDDPGGNKDTHEGFPQTEQEQDDQCGDRPDSPCRLAEVTRDEGDDLEAKRQELIRELCQTEETFFKRLHVFVRLFILPLRVQNSKSWISGVPSDVARLFDWLEDIMNLHSQLLSVLQATRTAQYPVVVHVAESIRAFMPRFEVYQPYLVRLPDVLSFIERLVQDETSDFGEFVDIQQGVPECDDWTFQMFLNEPVNRLAKYPEFFSRLLGLTPKAHPDYISTFSLVHSTHMVIHVLNEVKVREDEYDLIKSFSTRIHGLPPSVQLATRERRLLFHGLLHLVNTDAGLVHHSKSLLATSTISLDGSNNCGTKFLNRSSRLASAINEWDVRRGRSESTSSWSTGTSYNSLGTSSGASSDLPATPCSTFFSSYRISVPAGRLNSATSRIPGSPSPNPRHNSTICGTPVQVFVFTDLVVLAAPTSNLALATSDWTLLKNIGIARILGVPELPEQEPDDPSLIVLEVLPVEVNELNRGVTMDSGSLAFLRFIVPNQQDPVLPEKAQIPVVKDDVRRTWVAAFQRCFRYTLHSISVPPHSRYDPQLDLANDTHQTVFSLLASGLPLPKSPSVQEADLRHGEITDPTKEEREERGWWSVRFQQVFRELQRQDMALLSASMAL